MILAIIVVILVLGILVLVHELGHFILARRNGVVVEEFGIGFPPKLYGKKVGETLYSLNLIPLGGFVRLREQASGGLAGSFDAASVWAKTKILLAGVVMNLILAYLVLVAVAIIGLPKELAQIFNMGTPGVTKLSQAAPTVLYGWQAPVAAGEMLLKLSYGTLQGFMGLVEGIVRHGQLSKEVVGPVGLVKVFNSILALGLNYLLFLVATISVSLGVINLLPIPALDGGRLVFSWLRAALGDRFSSKIEDSIHTVGFVMLLVLMAVITFFDVRR